MYRFTSNATGDLMMFDAHAEQILEIIGKRRTPRGVITVDEIPEAVGALKRAIEREEKYAADDTVEDDENDEDEDDKEKPRKVRLGQRAYPFIEMLERAVAGDADVMWGV